MAQEAGRGGLTMDKRKPDAMDCWYFIAPLIPLADDFSMTVYVKTFHAFKLLEEEEKRKNGKNRRADDGEA